MKKVNRLPQLDLLEVVLIVALASTVAWKVGQASADQASLLVRPLQQKFGSAHNSEHAEEWIIRDFFNDRRGGFFVDVGANHYQHYSNTYYLDAVLGWSGIAVEPQREFADGYVKNRPRTKFRPFFVSSASNEQAKLYVLDSNRLVTSAQQEFTSRYGAGVKEVPAITITLDDLLDAEGVTSVDFMSMDIELWEPKALSGFAIERFRPALVCIEAHPEVRQQILDYFALHKYVVTGKYLRMDTQNLYFMPQTGPGL